jgi:hypothetical protein
MVMVALKVLESEGRIALWHDRMILPGAKWDREIREMLLGSDLVLLFVSRPFLRSKYVRKVEMREALQRAALGKMFVIPIILADCNWKKEEFAELLVLPTDGHPLANRAGKIEFRLLQNVIEGIRLALDGHWHQIIPGDLHGATMGATSRISQQTDVIPPLEPVLEPTTAREPVLMKGCKVSLNKPGLFRFLINPGDSGLSGEAFQRERSRLLEYFYTSAAIKAENIWVNLSPYETNRMLPAVLSGTQHGRDLLAFDCLLKRFAASALHPDLASGRAYWAELYKRARKRFGTSELPFASYNKVTVKPSSVGMYSPIYYSPSDWHKEESKWSNTKLGEWFGEPNYLSAYIVNAHLSVVCEVDDVALAHNSHGVERLRSRNKTVTHRALAELSNAVFTEIIVPVIEREVNEGQHFWTLRQIFYSDALASWFKRNYKKYPFLADQWSKSIDSDNPASMPFALIGTKSMRAKDEIRANPTDQTPLTHLNPNAEAFKVPENTEYYRQYQKLFSGGVYHVSRSEEGDTHNRRINRIYFSGAIDLSNIAALFS